MKELSEQVRRFQQIKAREREFAIKRAELMASNPSLTKEQATAMLKLKKQAAVVKK